MVEFDHFSIIFAPLLNHCMPFRFHFFCPLTPQGYFSFNSSFTLSVFQTLVTCPVIVYGRGNIQPVSLIFLNVFPIRNRLKRNETVLRIPGAVRTIFFSCPDQFIDLLCLDFLPLAKIPEDKPISK